MKYMRRCFLIHVYEENFLFFFISVGGLWTFSLKSIIKKREDFHDLTQNWLPEGSAWKRIFSGSVCVKKLLFKDDIRLNHSFSGIKYFCYMRSLQLYANPSG